MSWVSVGVAGAGAAVKIGTGIHQRNLARKLKANDTIPQAARENNLLSKYMFNATTYPGQAQDQARSDRNTGNAIGQLQKNAKSSTDILNSAGSIQARGANTNNDISQRYQQFKQQSLGRLMGSNQQLAGYQNQNMQQYYAAKSALLGGGLQNIWGGVNDIGGSIAAMNAPKPNYNYNFYGGGQ